MKKAKTFKLGLYDVYFELHAYPNGNMAVCLKTEDGLPYATATTNFGDVVLEPGLAFLNTNALPDIGQILEQHGFAKSEGKMIHSGWCVYPLYKFDFEEMREYTSPFGSYEI